VALQRTGSHNRELLVPSTVYQRNIDISAGANRRIFIGIAGQRFYIDTQLSITFNGVAGTLVAETTTGPAPRVHIWRWDEPAVGTGLLEVTNNVNRNDGVWFWVVVDESTGAVTFAVDESASDNNANPAAVVPASSIAFMIAHGLVSSNGGTSPFSTVGAADGVIATGVAPNRTYPSNTQLAAVTVVVPQGAAGPVITGPTGAPGAASITHSVSENQNSAGAWSASGGTSWSLSGTDAALLAISAGGVVTLVSGNFDHEAKASYSFNVLRDAVAQAVTLSVADVAEPPLAPTIGTATAGDATVSIAFTPPNNAGRPSITGYTATITGGITKPGASSPIVFTAADGVVNGTAYSGTVTATNDEGTGPPSAASNSVTPAAGSPPPPPPPPPAALNLAADDTGTVGVAGSATVTNSGGVSASWTLSSTPAGLTATPSSGTTAAGASTNISLAYASAATFALSLSSAASVSGSPQSIVVSAPPPGPTPPPPPPPPPAPAAGFDFHTAPGCIFGAVSGSLVGLAREVGVSILPLVYSRTAPYGLVATLPATATGSDGRLPRLTSASLSAGTTYRIVFVWPDGAEYAISMAATA